MFVSTISAPALTYASMHFAHELRRPEVELVVALVDEDALAIEHRAHRAVEDDDELGIEQPLDALHAASSRGEAQARRLCHRLTRARRSTSAAGWCTMIAAVDCSGTSWKAVVSCMPNADSAGSSLNTWRVIVEVGTGAVAPGVALPSGSGGKPSSRRMRRCIHSAVASAASTATP